MDAQDFLAALAPAVTDAEARGRFLADPRGVLAAAGLDLPEWFTVTAREGDVAELTITLPALIHPDGELTEANLATVGGGFSFTPPHSCAEYTIGNWKCMMCGRIMTK
jgi:hypothetical protein